MLTRSQTNLAAKLKKIPKGRRFTVKALAGVAGRTPATVRKGLPGLVKAGLVEVLKKGRAGSGGTGLYRRSA